MFDLFEAELIEYGYNVYYEVLNAKDYGVPQNRQRVYVIGIRKDVFESDFEFPKKFDNGLRLKDLLENNVDEKYYTTQEKTEKLISQIKDEKKYMAISNAITSNYRNSLANDEIKKCRRQVVVESIGNVNPSGNGMNGCVYHEDGLCPTITTNKGEGNKVMCLNTKDEKGNQPPQSQIIKVGDIQGMGHSQNGRVYDTAGLSPTLNGIGNGGNHEPKILEPMICASRGRYLENILDGEQGSPTEQKLEVNTKGVSNTITSVQKDNYVLEPSYRIRKLTSKECWRLMGFSDEDIDKCIESGISNSQLYKMAGNSICVPVLEAIFKSLFNIK